MNRKYIPWQLSILPTNVPITFQIKLLYKLTTFLSLKLPLFKLTYLYWEQTEYPLDLTADNSLVHNAFF